MAIANRVKRLFHADVNAVLDIIEEPEAILKQAIREMQEALDLKRARLARDRKHLSSLKASESHLKEQLAKVQKDLKLCLKEGSEELSRQNRGAKACFPKNSWRLSKNASPRARSCLSSNPGKSIFSRTSWSRLSRRPSCLYPPQRRTRPFP